MSVWAEAHDLPHLADPGKKIAFIPLLDYRTGRHADAFREEGAIKIPVGYARLDEVHFVDPDDHSNDVGSVIHIYQRECVGADGRPNPVGSFISERRPDDLQSRATSVTDISGRGLTSYFLDRMKLLPFDYPTNPTVQPDWDFGSDNLISNWNFEDNAVTPSKYSIEITATGGTFTFTDGTDITDPITVTGTPSTDQAAIHDALQDDIAAIVDVAVMNTSTSPNVFEILFVDPAYGVELTINVGSLSGGSAVLTPLEEGGLTPSPWHRAQQVLFGINQDAGSYDFFGVSDEQNHTPGGTYSLKINPGALGTASNRQAGAQVVVGVVSGAIYQASLWVYPTSSTDRYRLGIFTESGEWIAHSGYSGSSLTPNTWNQIVISDILIPSGTTRAIFRIQCTNTYPSNPTAFYIDDAEFYLGLPPITIGGAWEMIQDGRLAWLIPTFTDTLDSNGDAWDTERSFSLSEGDTWGQIAESFQRLWGYVHRIRYDREDNAYYFDIYNPGYEAFDHSTTDSGSLIVGMNILGGEIITRGPDATTQRVTGEGGVWVEETDLILEAAWGEADGFLKADKIVATADLQAILDQAQAVTLDRMITFESEMTNQGQVIPFRDIDVFHKISVQLGARSSIPRGDRIITSIVMSGKPGSRPSYQVYVNSDAFASIGAAALAEAVRRLLRRRIPTNPLIAASPFVPGKSKGMAHILIVSTSEPQHIQDKADYIVPALNSSAILQQIFDEVGGVWSIWMAGDFQLDSDVTTPNGAWIRGLGYPGGPPPE